MLSVSEASQILRFGSERQVSLRSERHGSGQGFGSEGQEGGNATSFRRGHRHRIVSKSDEAWTEKR
jgi:hypothetical protein